MSRTRRTGVEKAAFTVAPLAQLPTDVPCRSRVGADIWFSHDAALVDEAKALCRRCAFRVRCLDGALARREPWGVWGAELIEDGRIIVRRRPRGRPRKERPEA